jgi:hypothetical protein
MLDIINGIRVRSTSSSHTARIHTPINTQRQLRTWLLTQALYIPTTPLLLLAETFALDNHLKGYNSGLGYLRGRYTFLRRLCFRLPETSPYGTHLTRTHLQTAWESRT